jgi:RNA polymerase sigma-70 factor (ECF subfamily)
MNRSAADDPRDEPLDESAIRRAWDAGDIAGASTAALEQLGPQVLRYLSGILLDPDDADDAFSLFCERVWRSFPRFEWRCSVRTWAYVLARRASVDVVRSEHRHDRRRAALSDSALQAIADQVRTTTLPLLRTEGRTAIARLRDKLPPDDRTLLVLRVDQALQWNDLARVFLDKDSIGDDELRRESARLRQRFRLIRNRLKQLAREAGLLSDEPEPEPERE